MIRRQIVLKIFFICVILSYSSLLLAQEAKKGKIRLVDNTITFSTYYPAPFGVYKKLISDEIEAKSFLAQKIIPSYDSGWVIMPLVTKKNRKFYLLRLEHNLNTVETVVHVETKCSYDNEQALETAFGYVPLAFGPGVYGVVSGYPTLRFPNYSKDEKEIVVVIPAIPEETREDIFVRVLMWKY